MTSPRRKVSKARSFRWQPSVTAHRNSKEICPLYVFLCVHHSLQMQWNASKACLIIHSHKYVRKLSYSFPSQSWPCFPCAVAAPHAWRTDQWTLQSGVHFWRASRLFSPVQWAAHKLFRDGCGGAFSRQCHAEFTTLLLHTGGVWNPCRQPGETLARVQVVACASDFQRLRFKLAFCFREFKNFEAKSLRWGAEKWSRLQRPTAGLQRPTAVSNCCVQEGRRNEDYLAHFIARPGAIWFFVKFQAWKWKLN